MAYIQVLTHMQFSENYYSTGRSVLPWRKTWDKILFKSSCIRAKVFHRLSKKGQKLRNINYIYFSQDSSLSRTEILIILKAPSQEKGLTHKEGKEIPSQAVLLRELGEQLPKSRWQVSWGLPEWAPSKPHLRAAKLGEQV